MPRTGRVLMVYSDRSNHYPLVQCLLQPMHSRKHWNSSVLGCSFHKPHLLMVRFTNLNLTEVLTNLSYKIVLKIVKIIPMENPHIAPFTRIHCKSLPMLFSIILIRVSLSNFSRFSLTRTPIFEWFLSR